MKILVISDTHGKTDVAARLIKQLDPDYTFHLGDISDDILFLEETFPKKVITGIKGNNDPFDKTYPFERTATIGGKKFFMCHGHKYNVKSSYLPLLYKGKEVGADIVLFGHTHSAMVSTEDGIILLNPGSTATYGIIEIDGDEVSARVEKYV